MVTPDDVQIGFAVQCLPISDTGKCGRAPWRRLQISVVRWSQRVARSRQRMRICLRR